MTSSQPDNAFLVTEFIKLTVPANRQHKKKGEDRDYSNGTAGSTISYQTADHTAPGQSRHPFMIIAISLEGISKQGF
jgi:hypothetical protein